MRANLGRAFGESWNNYLPNIGVCIAAWIVGFVIIIVTLGILTGPIMGGFVRMGQRMKRGEKVDFNDLLFGFSRFGDFFLYGIFTLILLLIVGGINLVLSLIPLLGQLASLVIVMLFGAVISLGLVHMVEKSASVSEGFGMGFRLLGSSPLDVLVGGGLLALVGLVLPIITLLWAITGFFYLYEDLTTGPAPAQVPPPPPPPPVGGEGEGQGPPPPSGEPPAPPPPPGGEGGQPGVEPPAAEGEDRPKGEGGRPGQPPV